MATQGNENHSAPLTTDHSNQRVINERTALLRPTRNSTARRRRLFVTLSILVTELCERLTFYGVTANLVLFCMQDLKLDSPWPSVTNYLFQGLLKLAGIGTCYLIPLIGGWLADAYLGRYNTIYGSSLLYVAGTIVLMAVSYEHGGNQHAWPDSLQSLRRVYFVFALVMIAFGTGGIKANVSPFGADQVEQEGPRAVQTFFNWFYWFINVGSLISFTVVVWVQEYGLFYGYLITTGTMFLAMTIFVLGRNKYRTKPPGGSKLSEMVKIIHNAIKNQHSSDAEMWLDNAKTCFGGKYTDRQVEDVKLLLKVIPVFLLFVVYWIIYSQMQTSFLIQALHMRRKFSKFTIPAASMSLFDTCAVLAFAPIMDHAVYPLLHYCGIRFTPMRRIGVGMLIAAASVVVAGVIEIKRRELQVNNNQMLSVFWQVPQFMLIGISEVLAVVTGFELAYSQAPACFKGLVMGMFLLTSSLGNYAASLLVVIVQKASNHHHWYPPGKKLNEGHLEYFYFLLAVLMILNFVVFLFIALKYKYNIVQRREIIRDSRERLQPIGQDDSEITMREG